MSAKGLKASRLLEGTFNPLEIHGPFPVGTCAGRGTVAAPFLNPEVSLQFFSLSRVLKGRSASLMPGV